MTLFFIIRKQRKATFSSPTRKSVQQSKPPSLRTIARPSDLVCRQIEE